MKRRGVIPVASSLQGYGSPAPWEIDAGQARLAQLLRCGMMTPVLTNGEAADIAVVAGKGAKVQEIGLKKQASRWPSAYPIACRCRLRWELPQRRRRACGGDCRKPAARPMPPVLSPFPSGRERAAERAKLHDAPESAALPDP